MAQQVEAALAGVETALGRPGGGKGAAEQTLGDDRNQGKKQQELPPGRQGLGHARIIWSRLREEGHR